MAARKACLKPKRVHTGARIRASPRSIPLLPKHAWHTPLPSQASSERASIGAAAREVRYWSARRASAQLVPASGDTSEVRFDGISGWDMLLFEAGWLSPAN